MTKSQIERGGIYLAKVNGQLTMVRVLEVKAIGKGWTAENCRTGRVIRVTSARRFRGAVSDVDFREWLGKVQS